MITPDLILTHCYKYLPMITDRFTESVQVLSASINDDLQLVLNVTTANQFEVGRSYPITDIVMLNPVVSVVGNASAGWTLTTEHNHLLTKPVLPQDQTTFDLDTGWDDPSPINSIPSANQIFTRNGEASSIIGASLLERVKVGYAKLLNKAGNILTFELPADGYYYPCTCRLSSVVLRINIAVVFDANRAQEVYANACTDKLFAFIIMGDRDTIPSENQQAGVIAEGKRHVDDILVATAFSIVVVWPAKTDESQRKSLNEAYGAIYAALNSCLYGARMDSVYRIAPVGSGLAQINTLPNYAHAYEFQALDSLDVQTDGLRPDMQYFDVPMRAIEGNLLVDCGLTEPQPIGLSVVLSEGA